jgi:gliding motility associated protien GldN
MNKKRQAMKLKFLLILGVAFIITSTSKVSAQDDSRLTEVWVDEHVPNKKFIPYPYTREADVMWTKTIWRMIDMKEKQNLVLYYPERPIGERKSLITLLLEGIDNHGLTAYDPDVDNLNEFKLPITKEKLEIKMGAGEKKIKITNEDGETKDTTVKLGRLNHEVKKLLIKERWFFDRNYSTLQVRIIGLCPIRVSQKEDATTGLPTDEITRTQVCWIYFPQVRPWLANHMIYNPNNDAQSISFDDFFMQRRFSGYIVSESNVYNNRQIAEYKTGIFELYEAEKIKKSIFDFEQDLWEY